jgi:methionyl-tRNA formyltransferase
MDTGADVIQPEAGTETRRPLKVGVMLDSLTQAQWVHDILADIQQSGFAELALVIENADPDRPERGFVQRLVKNRRRIAYTLYTRLDDWLFRRRPDAFSEVSVAPVLAGVPVVRVRPIKKRFSDYFEPGAIAEVRAHDLDVILRFGFRILRGEALQLARFGVWSYHHGDNLVNRGGPPGFWEVMDGEPVTGSVLQILGDELDNGRVIYRSHAPTDRRSVRRNMDNFYRKSSAFVIRKLRDLADLGPAALDADVQGRTYAPYCRRLYREPGNLEMLALGGRLARRYAADKLRHALYVDQWALACRIHPGADGPDPALHRFKLLQPPRDRFWADPFPVAAGDRYYVFVEELPYATNKGHISALELDRTGALQHVERVLDQPHHLSYPFVFEFRGAHYMAPESGARRRVELYRADSFPGGWTLQDVLLDNVYAVDPTLVAIDGTWWMFVNIGVEGTLNYDELHIFHAPQPFGPWTPHRANPVKSDVRSARPAGRLFWWHGELYRPSQDCSGLYGSAIVFNRVTRLTPTEFAETAVSRLEPRWAPNLLGAHTINAAEGITVTDVLLRRPRFARLRSPVPAAAAESSRGPAVQNATEPLPAAGEPATGQRSSSFV